MQKLPPPGSPSVLPTQLTNPLSSPSSTQNDEEKLAGELPPHEQLALQLCVSERKILGHTLAILESIIASLKSGNP